MLLDPPRLRDPIGKAPAHVAALAYLLIALALTWPLARGLGRDVPADLGDPLFVMWVLSWDAEQLKSIAGGDLGRVPRFFDANIFYPARLSLAYSEHLFAQALQAFPVYLASRNPILCYNLLFLSTFVLSGLGVFLLVRELTGSARAGFIGGLLFAFAPYRWSQLSHLQVLSAQWLPFAVYAVRRYFATGARRPLAGAAVATALQALSSGYYLLYLAPIGALYLAWEFSVRGRWRSGRTWRDLALVASSVAMATLPFVLPYKQLRDALQIARPMSEIVRYSADVYSYLTASGISQLWGAALRVHSRPEGDLFPGAVALLLSCVSIVGWLVTAWRTASNAPPRTNPWVVRALGAIAGGYALVAVMAIFWRRVDLDLWLFSIRATNLTRLLVVPLAAAGALLWLSPALRARAAAAARRPEAIFLAILVAAWWLSLGPSPRVLGRPLELWSPYRLLMTMLPGFEGVRVPARFAMIVAFALSVLAAVGSARIMRGKPAAIVFALICVVSLLDVRPREFPLNSVGPSRAYATPEPRVYRPARAPAVYRELAGGRRDAVVLELPFGDPAYDIRAVYYSTVHWRQLVNGYSGFYPPHYDYLVALLSTVTGDSDQAWAAVQQMGVTHVVVHESAYLDDEGERISAWLVARGAGEVFRDGGDVLFELKR